MCDDDHDDDDDDDDYALLTAYHVILEGGLSMTIFNFANLLSEKTACSLG